MRHIAHRCLGLLLFSGLALGSAVLAEPVEEFSQANRLLFLDNHLKNIAQPTTLNYRFEKSGSLESGFTDAVRVQVRELHENGTKKVAVRYFTGTREKDIPDIDGATGNPLLTVFLQRDVREMARLTGGHWRHFQKQIKLALENAAQVTRVEVALAGRQAPASRILIHPYRDDPMAARFRKYSTRYYVFTLVEELPGVIYEIRAVTPSNTGSPLIEETLTYVEGGKGD